MSKRRVSVLVALMLMLSTILAVPVNADSFKWSNAKGSTDDSYSFFTVTINTKAKQSDYVLLQHTNKMYYHSNEKGINGMWYKRLRRSYGKYRIYIYGSNGKQIKSYVWDMSKEKKLTLKDFGFKKVNFKKTYTYIVKVVPINAFSNTSKKQFLHWSGKKCNEYSNACHTPNKWKAGYKSSKGGVVDVTGCTLVN